MTPPVASVGEMSAAPTLPAAPATLDPESREWLRSLREDGARREDAIRRLHALLLKAARFEVARRRATSAQLRAGEVDEIAYEAADDALVSVLARLDTFRGASRFTTWAYKFALLEAAVKVRRRAWQGREVPLAQESWNGFAAESLGPDEAVEQRELLDAVREEIDARLTPHQRRVLLALAVDGVPIDVLAERLGTTRGALYKTLHDARRKLRASLAERGLATDTSEEVTR
jgi:RNA polymerase sigma-70 factor, ECF subfamily